MSQKQHRTDFNPDKRVTFSLNCNFNYLKNLETISISYAGNIFIWLIKNISDGINNRYSMSYLSQVNNVIVTFTDTQGCLKHINKHTTKNKFFLVVPDSLGQDFVLKIVGLPWIR